MSDLLKIVDNTLIPHTSFIEVRKRLNQCFDYAAGASEPICLAVIGESRTGKSRVLEETMHAHPATRGREGLDTPILRVTTPSVPTVKGLVELMLNAMHDPMSEKGTENAKTLRLKTLMRKSHTRMVMIDEFQHFYDKGRHKVMHHVADWLKILVDEARVALVVAGLPSCQAVIDQNEQLAGRFLSAVRMPRFDWADIALREEFCAILGAFHVALKKHFRLPELDSEQLAFRCYCGTGGLMGYLTKFLRQMVWNAVEANTRSITLEQLAIAHYEAMWSRDGIVGIPSPFSRDFNFTPTDELLSRIRLIGTPVAPEVPSRRPRQKTAKNIASAASVLSAT